jgi:hypothetical protein
MNPETMFEDMVRDWFMHFLCSGYLGLLAYVTTLTILSDLYYRRSLSRGKQWRPMVTVGFISVFSWLVAFCVSSGAHLVLDYF